MLRADPIGDQRQQKGKEAQPDNKVLATLERRLHLLSNGSEPGVESAPYPNIPAGLYSACIGVYIAFISRLLEIILTLIKSIHYRVCISEIRVFGTKRTASGTLIQLSLCLSPRG